MNFCSSNHKTCHDIRTTGGQINVAVFPVNKYNQQTWVGYLVLKKSSQLWDLVSGHLRPEDNGCFLRAAARILAEQMKLLAPLSHEFDRHFKNGKMHYIMINGIPVFIGIFQHLSRKPLNDTIAWHNSNLGLPSQLRTTLGVDIFRFADRRPMDNVVKPMAPTAELAMRMIQIPELENHLANYH